MRELKLAVPDHEVLLAMQPEELGEQIVLAMHKRNPSEMVHLGNALGELFHTDPSRPSYPREHQATIERAFVEAFAWLEAQVLLIPSDASTNGRNGFRVLSRRAREMRSAEAFAQFRASQELPKALLHPTIKSPVWLSFVRGEYDTAVFQAMKAVEVAVREAASLADTDIGVNLMRKAFHPETGALTDPNVPVAEREALANLFAGAIGSYKNPHSHRNVPLDDPAEAAEIAMLASHLLKIVDDRRERFHAR